jgi:hypothetical protein
VEEERRPKRAEAPWAFEVSGRHVMLRHVIGRRLQVVIAR